MYEQKNDTKSSKHEMKSSVGPTIHFPHLDFPSCSVLACFVICKVGFNHVNEGSVEWRNSLLGADSN